MVKIKWNWRLRIKKNSKRIQSLESSMKDLDPRIKDLEERFEDLDQIRHDQRAEEIKKIEALEEKLASHHKQEEVYLKHTVNCEKKIEVLESAFKKLFRAISENKYSKADLNSDLALVIKNELKQLESDKE